jgi:TRAP-type transport system small permease protein
MARSIVRTVLGVPAAGGGLILVGVMLLTVVDVALRYLLHAPLRGVFELTELAMVGTVFLGLGQAQQHRQHIINDLAYEPASPRVRGALDRLSRLVSAAVVLLVTWQLGVLALRMRADHDVTGVLGLPVYATVAVALVGFALYALALLRTHDA